MNESFNKINRWIPLEYENSSIPGDYLYIYNPYMNSDKTYVSKSVHYNTLYYILYLS